MTHAQWRRGRRQRRRGVRCVSDEVEGTGRGLSWRWSSDRQGTGEADRGSRAAGGREEGTDGRRARTHTSPRYGERDDGQRRSRSRARLDTTRRGLRWLAGRVAGYRRYQFGFAQQKHNNKCAAGLDEPHGRSPSPARWLWMASEQGRPTAECYNAVVLLHDFNQEMLSHTRIATRLRVWGAPARTPETIETEHVSCFLQEAEWVSRKCVHRTPRSKDRFS